MKRLLAIRHVAFEDLGAFAPVLRERGYEIRYLDAGQDDLAEVDPMADDLWVVLGGPIGVYDDRDFPFLTEETNLLQARLSSGRAVLGICLGAQLIARALGAAVYPGGQKELGFAPVSLTPEGTQSPLACLSDGTPVLHWHGDTFDLPTGSILLARTNVYAHQAFAFERHALALQFHVETTARGLERWFIGHALEIATTPGQSVPALRADAARWAPTAAARGQECLRAWLDNARL